MSQVNHKASTADRCQYVSPWDTDAGFQKQQQQAKIKWDREAARRRLRIRSRQVTRGADGSLSLKQTGKSIGQAFSNPVSTLRESSSLLWEATKEKARNFGTETSAGWSQFSTDVRCAFSGE